MSHLIIRPLQQSCWFSHNRFLMGLWWWQSLLCLFHLEPYWEARAWYGWDGEGAAERTSLDHCWRSLVVWPLCASSLPVFVLTGSRPSSSPGSEALSVVLLRSLQSAEINVRGRKITQIWHWMKLTGFSDTYGSECFPRFWIYPKFWLYSYLFIIFIVVCVHFSSSEDPLDRFYSSFQEIIVVALVPFISGQLSKLFLLKMTVTANWL